MEQSPAAVPLCTGLLQTGPHTPGAGEENADLQPALDLLLFSLLLWSNVAAARAAAPWLSAPVWEKLAWPPLHVQAPRAGRLAALPCPSKGSFPACALLPLPR